MSFSVEIYDFQDSKPTDAAIRMHRGQLDAIVLRNVFNGEELNRICGNLSRISGDQLVEMVSHETVFGYTFPRVHATADDFKEEYSETLAEYFNYSGEVKRLFPELLGIDVEARLRSAFEKLTDGKPAEVPRGINGNGSFTPFTIRSIYPRRGGLPVHNDRDFLNVNKQCHNHLSLLIDTSTQASFFAVLSAPDENGSLRFFEELEDQSGEAPFRTTHIFFNNDSVSEHGGAERIRLDAGDLIVFLSTKIFHQVDDFDGYRNRLTIGGYTGLAKNGSTLYFWS